MKLSIALLVLLLCGLALYLARSSSLEVPEPREPLLSSLQIREQPLGPLPVRADATRAAVEQQAESGSVALAVAPSSAAFNVRVLVLARDDRRPLAGLKVQLVCSGPEADAPFARGTSDASGAVNMRLEGDRSPHGLLCTIQVVQGERTLRFAGIPLRDEIEVLLDACTRLHGQLVISGVEAGARAWVQLNEPRRGAMSCAVMLSRTQADADGRFELQACPSREVPVVDVQVSVGSLSVTRRVRWEALAGEAGARIELACGELLVRVVDTAGSAIVGAEVRISSANDDAVFPAVGRSDARGEFRVALEATSYVVIAGATGYSSKTENLELVLGDAPLITLSLRKLGSEDLLVGRVVNEDGMPIEAALVTASPAIDSREAALAGVVQIRSDAEGNFELAIETDRELDVVAFHRDMGMSDEVRLRPRGRRLELVIRPRGSVEVRIAPPPGLRAFTLGLAEYVLVDRRLAYFDHSHNFTVPIELDDVPVGDYQVFVYVAGWNAYAEGSVRIEAGKTAQLELASQTAHFSSGRVRRADGSAAGSGVITLEHPSWPPEVEQLWSSPLIDGRFESFLGAESSCAATLRCPERSPHSVQLHSGLART